MTARRQTEDKLLTCADRVGDHDLQRRGLVSVLENEGRKSVTGKAGRQHVLVHSGTALVENPDERRGEDEIARHLDCRSSGEMHWVAH